MKCNGMKSFMEFVIGLWHSWPQVREERQGLARERLGLIDLVLYGAAATVLPRLHAIYIRAVRAPG